MKSPEGGSPKEIRLEIGEYRVEISKSGGREFGGNKIRGIYEIIFLRTSD